MSWLAWALLTLWVLAALFWMTEKLLCLYLRHLDRKDARLSRETARLSRETVVLVAESIVLEALLRGEDGR